MNRDMAPAIVIAMAMLLEEKMVPGSGVGLSHVTFAALRTLGVTEDEISDAIEKAADLIETAGLESLWRRS